MYDWQDCHCEEAAADAAISTTFWSNAGDCRATLAMTESQEDFLVKPHK